MRKKQIQNITITALLSALCIILYFYVKFPLPFFPPFLEINFSMLPAILCGYIAGPIWGTIVVIIRFFVKLSITHTAGVGEIADLLIGCATVLTTSIIYHFNRNRKGAVLSLFLGGIVWVIAAALFNWLLLVPAYISLYFNNDLEKFIAVLKVIPSVNEENYMWKYLLYAAIPFNALLATIVSVITFLVYKPLRRILKENELENKKAHEKFTTSVNLISKNECEIEIKIYKD